ncbi:methionine--tRNA ligase [Legionella hackeliae]|uniref:Methionine--tRNA ligase n=1 Tax=Legionella hackeliae TaxID=449 RepID=A0A0A8UNQ4_LEGHA|nr:methionine--tRNA ligase [Legionella hackeliae]KTD14189.1 methionyl-tRNA synthetase [Legionella hackeliae]CEK10398.1 Methionine--tRNA ligase [Legionella hackeliae]STX47134.1 methionyl-tRNA synthetase [Legionella hackeliae]
MIKKEYLLLPSVPTPNGPLHLGHIGGPYLSADILSRYLRTQGHSALLLCGTDSFESYVTAQAEKENKPPQTICDFYHPAIENDLQAMDIQVDYFLNPLNEQWFPRYKKWHEKILHQLMTRGFTQLITEQFAWNEQHQRYLVGCWLEGFCPVCNIETESYFCEECGAHYRPEEAYPKSISNKKDVTNLFLKLPFLKTINLPGVSATLNQKFLDYLNQQNGLFRLTTNADWGLPYNNSSTLFSYGFIFCYFLLFGELAGELTGKGKNAFAADSDITTIASFGHDNFLPFLSSTLGISAACEGYKPFDYYLVNYFYALDGNKFSTSRRHAIWVGEVIHNKRLSSDVIRAYLASINVREKTGNFNSAEFNHYYSYSLEWIKTYVFDTLPLFSSSKPAECPADIKSKLLLFLARQESALNPHQFSPHIAINSLSEWLQVGHELKSHPSYFWWLQTLALFIYPFMPRLGGELWQILGYQGIPLKEQLFTPSNGLYQQVMPFKKNYLSREYNDALPFS